MRDTVKSLEGAYALAVMSVSDPDRLVIARAGCPAIVGVGDGENFVASDVAALLPVTRHYMILEEGDVAIVDRESIKIYDSNDNEVEREVIESELIADAAERGDFGHYMQKEIHEQASAVAATLEERTANGKVLDAAFGPKAIEVLSAHTAADSQKIRQAEAVRTADLATLKARVAQTKREREQVSVLASQAEGQASTLEAALKPLAAKIFEKDGQLVAKQAEMEAELKGIRGETVAGKGPKYRALKKEADLLAAEKGNLELQQNAQNRPLDRLVNMHRFGMEVQRHIEFMEAHANRSDCITFFDGSLVGSFAEVLDLDCRNFYAHMIDIESCRASIEIQTMLSIYRCRTNLSTLTKEVRGSNHS